jgi:methyl-accepting chemotaxis protein
LVLVDALEQRADRPWLGDLTARISDATNDEAGRLLGAIGNMTNGLHSLVTRVKKASIDLSG